MTYSVGKFIILFMVFLLFESCETERVNENASTISIIAKPKLQSKLQLKRALVLDESAFKIGEILSTTTYVDEINGEIYLNDAKSHIFACYNNEGKFKQLLGKKGRGPGEFVYPLYLTKDRDGNTYIFDMKKFCTVVYNADKQFLREYTYPELFPDTGELQIKNGKKIICLMAPKDNSSYYKNISMFQILDDNFNIVKSVIIDFPDIYTTYSLTTYTSLTFEIDLNYVYVQYAALPAVYKYDFDGRLQMIMNVNTSDFRTIDIDLSKFNSTIETVKAMSPYSYGVFLQTFKERYLFFGYFNEKLPDDGTFDIRAGKKYRKYYYNIITTEGEQVLTEKSLLPGEPLYCTPGGELYILLNDEPKNRKIGVYEIVLEEM